MASVAAIVACLACALAASAADVRVEETAAWTRIEADLEGSLTGFALSANPDGSRSLVLLVGSHEPGPEESASAQAGSIPSLSACPPLAAEDRPPTSVYRWDPSRRGELRLLRNDLPGDAGGMIALDLDGDGSEEPIMVPPIEAWGSRAGPPPPTRLAPGRLSLLGARPDGTGVAVVAEIELPRHARATKDGWLVETRAPAFVGRRADGTILYATPAEARGKQRLHALLIEIAPGGATRIADCWMRLPAPEDLLEQRFLFAGDRPLLFVSTKPAGTLSLFGEKQLRLFPVENDRTRLGRPASFATTSRMNLWQMAEPSFVDVDGDARDDLVVGYWKGLKDSKVVLDAYRRREDGSLATSAETTAFDVRAGDRSFLDFGHDLDGDGRSDLVLRAAGQLRFHRGVPSRRGANLVDEKALEVPWRSVDGEGGETYIGISNQGFQTGTTGTAEGRPQFVDLDGDGRAEVLAVHRGGFQLLWMKRGDVSQTPVSGTPSQLDPARYCFSRSSRSASSSATASRSFGRPAARLTRINDGRSRHRHE